MVLVDFVGKHSMSSNTSVRPQKAVGEILDENAEENQCAVKHAEENTFAVIGNKSDLALFGVSFIKHTLQVYRACGVCCNHTLCVSIGNSSCRVRS